MANDVELNELVNMMEGKPSTNGWDVVASYSVKQLNAFLAAQYEAGKLAKAVALETEREDPITGMIYTIKYDIQFASPALSFIAGRSGFATLTMPLNEGSFAEVVVNGVVQRTIPIPGGKFNVQAVVPLAAIKGDTGEVVEHDHIVTFSDGNPHDTHVIVHFNSEKGTLFQIVPTPDPKDHDILVTYFLPVLRDYFQTQIQAINYALTSINNKRPDTGATILTPKSFVFASTGDEKSGILSLYIQTAESGNPPGNPTPSFQPGGQAVDPIPRGYTASIILSNRLMVEAFLKPQLEAAGFSVAQSNPVSGGGIFAYLQRHENIIAVGEQGRTVFSNHSYEGLSISMYSNPIVMNLQHGAITLAFAGYTRSEWCEGMAFHRSGTYGGVHVTIRLQKGPIPLSITDDVVGVNIAVDPFDFTIELKAVGCNIFERMTGCSTSYPSYYRDLRNHLQFPNINLNLPGLDFFNTTNLLSPGQNVIHLDTSKGVQTPHDFMVVGNVTSLTRLRALRAGASAVSPAT